MPAARRPRAQPMPGRRYFHQVFEPVQTFGQSHVQMIELIDLAGAVLKQIMCLPVFTPG